MRVKTWRVLTWGRVPRDAHTIPFECQCGSEALLPVLGRPIAITGGHLHPRGDDGVIFDIGGTHAIPPEVQCRRCGRILTTEQVA